MVSDTLAAGLAGTRASSLSIEVLDKPTCLRSILIYGVCELPVHIH